MNEAIVTRRLDDWMGFRGPARRELLSPLGDLLIPQPPPPDDASRIVEPARHLLERAGRGQLRLAGDGTLRRGFAAKTNQEFGFDSPPYMPGGEITVLEIDALFEMLRGLDTIGAMGKKAFLTHLGRGYLDDPIALWYTLSSCVGLVRPMSVVGELWELILGWLLADDPAMSPLSEAIDEAARADHQADPSGEPLDEERLTVAFFSLYTFLRALDAFVPRPRDAEGRPTLRPSGRLTAIEALRAAIATMEYASVA